MPAGVGPVISLDDELDETILGRHRQKHVLLEPLVSLGYHSLGPIYVDRLQIFARGFEIDSGPLDPRFH